MNNLQFDTRPFRLLLLVLVTAAAVLALRPDGYVFHSPFTEDSFYSLAVARHFAAGHGITADGVQPTNGFQPLFTALCAGIYWLTGGDEVATLRGITWLSWAIWLGTGLLLGAIAADAGPGEGAGEGAGERAREAHARAARRWLAMLLHLGAFLAFMHHFNGLETGLLLFLYAVCWRAWAGGLPERGLIGTVAMGGLLGLLVLTRIDAAVVVAAICAWQFVARLRLGVGPALLRALLLGGVALIVASPWFVFNYVELGSFMPTSGTAQQEWGVNERRLRWIFWALGVSGLPGLWLGRLDEMFGDGIALSVLRAGLGLGLIGLFVRAVRGGRIRLGGPTAEFAGMMLAGFALLALYYGLSFIAYWFYYRYLFPLTLLASVGIALTLAPTLLRWPRLGFFALALISAPTVISMLLAQQGRTLHVETVYWDQMALISRHVPPDVPVAAGQAGTLGYFRAATVNVDGKVNRAAIPHQDRMWDWLAERNVRWFCDWDFYVRKYLGSDPAAHGWHKVDQLGAWELWLRTE